MAQQDTGLGWSAESEWLVSTESVEVGSSRVINAPDFPNQPAPFVDGSGTWAERAAVGMVALDFYWSGTFYQYKITRQTDAPMFLCLINRGSYKDFFIISTVRAGIMNHLYYNPATGSYSRTGSFGGTYTQDSTTGLYYTGGGSPSSVELSGTEYIPTFSSESAALAAINVAVNTFYKENAGYAVVCVAKWKTSNGTELISPILISSNTDFVDMTMTGTGNYMAKFNGLLSGVRFFMAFWDIPGNTTFTTTFRQIDLTDRGNMDLEQLFMTIISTSYAHVIIINSPDPYEEEGAGSEEEGGDGEETGDDDAGIEAGSDFPSAINTGFCRIYSPSESELRNLSNYLWSNSYDLAQVKKLFSNPMDSILGLSAVPIRLLGSSVSFSLGGVPITGMTLPLVTQQRYTYHMGTITIKERWGSYLDYDPYTKFSIFLPFIGMRELAADDIMGKTVSLVYDIDILTGMCVARLQAGTNCLYEWGGNCAIQLPINSRNWDSVFSTAVSAVGGIVSAVTGGSAPLVAGSVASAALQTVSMKPRIDKSSTIGGAAGWLGQMTPYIVRTTPEAFIPADQNKFIGYPAYINVNLGAISGYNEVESIHLENVTATGAELEEIESILKGGVIF